MGYRSDVTIVMYPKRKEDFAALKLYADETFPDQFEVHEWSIMERFSASVEDERRRDALLDAIHGSGAFRRFKDTICRLGVEDDWYRFRDSAIEEVAIEWLEDEGIPFTRDSED